MPHYIINAVSHQCYTTLSILHYIPMINCNILSTLHYFVNAVLHHQRFFTPATLLYIVNASSHYQCCIQKWNRDLTELHHVMQSYISEFCRTTYSISAKGFLRMFHGAHAPKIFKETRK